MNFRLECDDEELVAAYRSASCVVLPSVYRDMYGQETRVPELLGQTLLEGMACGCACIATNVTSLPEVVAHGVTGLVVPPNDPAALRDAINWMQNRPDERRLMGELSSLVRVLRIERLKDRRFGVEHAHTPCS